MAAITTAIGLGLGAASFGYGLYEKEQGKSQAAKGYALQQQGYQIQAQAAAQKAGISREQATQSEQFAERNFNLEYQAAQDSLNVAMQSGQINKQIVQYQQQAEALRAQGMELDARRRQTEIIRNQQKARALGLATATAQGARQGTGLQGGYGQISGQTGNDLLATQQSLGIGRGIFASNQNISNARIQHGDLETLYAQQRAALTTARSQMVLDYARVNAAFQTRMADTDTFMSQGAGLVNQGSGFVSAGSMQQQSGAGYMQAGMQLPGLFQTAGSNYQSIFQGKQPVVNANPNFNWANYVNPYYGPGF